MKHKAKDHYDRSVTIQLNTPQSYLVLKGKKGDPTAESAWQKEGFIGGVTFYYSTCTLINASKNDNPYADWWLIAIEKQIDELKRIIITQHRRLKEKLSDNSLCQSSLSCKKPESFTFDFEDNVYAYMVLDLIVKFDELNCYIETCSLHGHLDSKESQVIRYSLMNRFRQLFEFAFHKKTS